MRSAHRLSGDGVSALLAVGLLLGWPAQGWPQSIAATLPVAGNAVAINKVTDKIYVAESKTKGSGIVTVIDGATHSTLQVPAGDRPWALVVNEATNKIYVVNFGDVILGGLGSITVIDGVANSTTTVFAPGDEHPLCVAVNPVTDKIYVGNYSGDVTVIDGATNAIAAVIAPSTNGVEATAVAVNSETNKIYVANTPNPDLGLNAAGNVTVIDGATNSTTTVTDPNAIGPNALAVNTVTNKIYVTNGGAYPTSNHGNVTVIDGATNSTITVTDPNALAPQTVAVNSTTNKIYVANANNAAVNWKGVVTVIDGATNGVTTVTDPNAEAPGRVTVNEATNVAYVTNGGCVPGPGNGCSNPGANPGSITIIGGAANSVATIIDPKANSPQALAVNPVSNQIYVANAVSGNLTVIDGGGTATTHTIALLLPGSGAGTVTSNPVGINCGTTCADSYAIGTAVKLAAAATPGSYFAGWSGPCSGTSSCDVVANTDQFVSATFNSTVPTQVAAPNVLGQTQALATTAITGAGLVVGTVTQQPSSTIASGDVISESPAAGANVAAGSAVNLVVSSGDPSTGGSSSSSGDSSGGGGGIDLLTLVSLLGCVFFAVRRIVPLR